MIIHPMIRKRPCFQTFKESAIKLGMKRMQTDMQEQQYGVAESSIARQIAEQQDVRRSEYTNLC